MINKDELFERYEIDNQGFESFTDYLIQMINNYVEESKKKGNVLSTLDEMIRNEESHVEMMKALEQGLGLPETWKEMIE